MIYLKNLIGLMNDHPWTYWFIGVFSILYTSTQIQNKTANEVLFERYAPIASNVEVFLFAVLIAFIIFKWITKKQQT